MSTFTAFIIYMSPIAGPGLAYVAIGVRENIRNGNRWFA